MNNIKKPWFKKPSRDVTRRMRKVKSSNTGLEKIMESLLRKGKIKYSKHPTLFGHPDFIAKGSNVLIFCDSSFWHGRRRKELKGETFNKNKAFWINKLMENRKRDIRINKVLTREGWRVLRFWDTDILKFSDKVLSVLKAEIKSK